MPYLQGSFGIPHGGGGDGMLHLSQERDEPHALHQRTLSMQRVSHHRLHIGFDDPDAFKGTEEEILPEFRRVRDEIIDRFTEFRNEIA